MNKKLFISVLAVLANLVLAIGKVLTGAITNSASILADGINSSTDVLASLISFAGIKYAEKPADKEHPYGHGKAEVISGFVITIIILVSGVFIIYDAINGFFTQEPLSITLLAFIVMGASAAINAIMSQLKIHYGKKHNSISLITDGVHSRIDLLVSATIFIGLFFITYVPHLDSILALLVGIYILKESLELGKDTTDTLLGSSCEKTEKKIKDLLKKEKIEITNLKTQKLGEKVFAEIKIKLPSKIKIQEAEKVINKLEKDLTEKIQELDYTSIQVESHNIGIGHYKTLLGQERRFKNRNTQTTPSKRQGTGPGGYCICPKCGYKEKHKPGTPCSEIKCPKCKSNLTRQEKN